MPHGIEHVTPEERWAALQWTEWYRKVLLLERPEEYAELQRTGELQAEVESAGLSIDREYEDVLSQLMRTEPPTGGFEERMLTVRRHQQTAKDWVRDQWRPKLRSEDRALMPEEQ